MRATSIRTSSGVRCTIAQADWLIRSPGIDPNCRSIISRNLLVRWTIRCKLWEHANLARPIRLVYRATCDAEGCVEYAEARNNIPLMRDGDHLSEEGAELIVKRLIESGRLRLN